MHAMRRLLLGRSNALKNQNERTASGTDIYGFIAGIQHQYRLLHAFGSVHAQNGPPPADTGMALSDGAATRRSTRASVSKVTDLAPPRFRTRAQAAAVAPVVITSSIRRIRSPVTSRPRRRRKAPATFPRRPEWLRPACARVERERASRRTTGTPQRRAIG